ncbi:MAG: site-2 protease family protein [Candidatus Micrarchaeota archaeon]|nr:site-2 protease family protein [Candidatus Micrarchaeota archaeon]
MNKTFYIDLEELSNLSISILAVTLSIVLASYGFSLTPLEFAKFFSVYLISVGSGFLFHELAHKFVAINFGHSARFISWQTGLFIMLGLALLIAVFQVPLPLFLAPGAVVIFSSKRISKFENGIISAAGPITNIILAVIFFVLAVLFLVARGDMQSLLLNAFLIGVKINLFLAFFNLLPIFPLDGSKIFAWNKIVWVVLFLISLLVFFI